MSQKHENNLQLCISVADYISEGHSITEAAKEFRCSRTTIQRHLKLLATEAFYNTNRENSQLLKLKCIKAQKTLDTLAKEHNANNIGKWNAKNSKKVTP